ncbi:MAG TPA: molybdopterin-dependent oxidoreductase [Candidatus Limnocylindrales bacterium]
MESRLAWAATGIAAAAVAVGVGEVVAGVFGSTSAIAAVGALVIALQPPGAKDFMVGLFGTNDKLALEIGVFIGGLLVGVLIGLAGGRDRRFAYAGFALLGIVGLVLILQDPLEDAFAGVITISAAVAAGVAMFQWLASMLVAAPLPAPRVTPRRPAQPVRGVNIPRRAFLVIAGTFVAVGAVLSVIGRFLGSQTPQTSAAQIPVPSPGSTVAPPPSGASFDVAGITPIVTPDTDFYIIDTRLSTPQVDASTWSLRIHGMVDKEVKLNYQQLIAMALTEQYVTIQCVSNEVGGALVGNAKWTGVNLNSVLAMAGVQPGATQLVGTSFDGWTCGFPTQHLQGAGKDALLAVQMNDQPLPARHGYPARLIVPGLYGYVSATKWITDIELTTLEAFDAYWVRLGWAKQGPILTQSRIDVPRAGQNVQAGSVEFGGVAWAPTRGVSKVEVDLDVTGNWQPCELSVPLSDYTWVQWRTTLQVPAGQHTIRVRATDGTGAVQEQGPTPPAPDGARGWMTRGFSAS